MLSDFLAAMELMERNAPALRRIRERDQDSNSPSKNPDELPKPRHQGQLLDVQNLKPAEDSMSRRKLQEDPCPAEGEACFADDTCISVLPEQESDFDACFANELCGALLQCHMDADPGGGGGPPECVAAQLADCGEDFGKSSTTSLLRLLDLLDSF